MNVLIQLCHPAQFHYYKNTIKRLEADGHKVDILIKSKDILEDLLKYSAIPYHNILPNDHRGSKFGYLFDMISRDWRVLVFALKNKSELLTGSTPEISHIGWLLRRHSINIGEDDAAIIRKYVKVTAPFLDTRMTPVVCDNGKMEKKAIKFEGYWKLAYLHPNVFTPDRKIVNKYFSYKEPYFLIRFAKLCAHHDDGIKGISVEVAKRVINKLLTHGNVYISSEKPLPDELEHYRIKINPLDIHHVMSYANLYLGDSQSMAVEASILGVPALRFNDFAGKIGVLEELEHKYELTYGIPSSEPQRLYDKIDELMAMPNLRETFQQRRQRMLKDKIDVTAFFTWFIENYPESKKVMRDNPGYQERFRL